MMVSKVTNEIFSFIFFVVIENISWFIWYKIKKEKMNKSNLILCGIENSK
jgi:hypothetical protein